jgi:DNA-binding transcriptional regulator YiaG
MNQSIKGIKGGTMELFNADEIPDLIDRSGWSRQEWADYMDCSTNTISSWYKGKKKKTVKQTDRTLFIAVRKQLIEAEELKGES